tara:strand:- start:5764 stop:6546 length:783 start_codon:yes stop_codon:yes gene_type:complete
MASPYQLAGARATLADLMQKSNLQKQQSQTDTTKKMGKMQDEFEKELEALQARARKRSKKNKLFGNVLNLVGLGLGPLGAGLTKGLSSAISLQDQKTGAKMLLDKGMQQKYGSNFLRRGMKDFTEQAQDAQVSSGDVLRGAFGSGLAGFAMSKALGGDKETGGIFKKMKEAKNLAADSDIIKELPLKDFLESGKLKMPKGFDMSKLKGVSPEALLSKNPALTQLFESFKGLSSGDGIKGGIEGIQSAMMLPLLIQQILGD